MRPFSRLISLSLALFVFASAAAPVLFGQDAVFIGRRRQDWGIGPFATQPQLQIYTTGNGLLKHPVPGAPIGIGPNDGGEPFIVFRQNGKIYLAMAPEVRSVIAVMEYDPATNDLLTKAEIPVSNGAQDLMFDHNQQILYYGKRGAGSVAVNSFREIHSLSLANASSLTPTNVPAEKLVRNLAADCRNADITPDGSRILLKCLPAQLLDLNTASGSVTTHSLPAPYVQENLKIEPSQGKFAYSVNGAAPFDITVLDLSNLSNPTPPTIPGLGFGGAITFHPTGKWAYYSPGNLGGQIALLETGPGGTPASSFKTAATLGFVGRAGYGLMASGDQAYLLTLGNGNYGEPQDYRMIRYAINPDGTLTQAAGPTKSLEGNDVNAAPQGAIIPVLPIRVDTEPAQLGFKVGVDSVGDAIDLYEISNAPIGAHKVSVDPSVAPANPNVQWTFLHWKVDGVPDTTMTNIAGQDVVLRAPGRTFTALFEKRVRLNVNVTGLCTVSPLPGFYPDGSTQPVNVTVNANETLNSIEFLANLPGSTPVALNNNDNLTLDGEGGTITVSCTPVTPDPTHQVLATPPNQGLQVRANNSPLAVAPLAVSWVPNSTPNSVGTVTPQLNTAQNTAYRLVNWTSSDVATTGPGPNTPDWQNLNGPPASTIFTANFVPAGYTVTLTGCPATVGPSSSVVTSSPVVTYSSSAPLQLLANPPAGTVFDNFTVTMGSSTVVLNSNPANVTLIGPATVTANCSAAPTCAPPPAGLSAWYSFEEASGSTSASRISSAPSLNWVGNPTPLATAKVNRGLTFNGAQYLEAPNASGFDPGTNSFSFDFWLRASAPVSGNATLFGKLCGGILGGPGCLGPSVHGWRVELTPQGRLDFWLGTTGSVGVAASSSPLAMPNLADGNWHFVAAVVNRATGVITVYIDGTAPNRTFTIPFNLPTAGNMAANLPFRVGANGLNASYFSGSLDELEIFTSTAVSAVDFQRIFDAGSLGKCPPVATPVNVTVNTNPPNIKATVGVQTSSGPPVSQLDSITVPLPTGLSALTVSASSPVLDLPGTTRYVLRTANTWSVNGTPNPLYTGSPQPVPAPTADTTYTANYDTQYEVKVVVNGSCTVTPVTNFFRAGLNLPVTITPAAGATATWAFPGGSLPLTSGQSFPVLAPGTLTVNCGSATPNVLVNTVPANIGVTVGLSGLTPGSGSGSNTDSYSTTATVGATGSAFVSPIQKFNAANNTRWDFKNWTNGGILFLGFASTLPVTIGPGLNTFTAYFDTSYKIDVINNGCASVSPVAGFYPANSNVTVSVTPGPNQVAVITFGPPSSGGGTSPAPIPNNSTWRVDSPKVLTATCGATPTGVVVVNTNPPNLNVTVGVQSVGSQPNSYTSPALPAGNITLTANPTGPLVTPGGARMQLLNWRQGSSVIGPGPTHTTSVITGATTTYTAFYELIGSRVTVVNNGCASTSITPPLPSDGILPAASTINLGATPAAGGSFTNVTLSITDPYSGLTQTVGPFTTLPFLNPIGLPGPTVITFNCATPSGVGVTVNTSPANLGASVGISNLSSPNGLNVTLPAGSSQTLIAPPTVVTAGGLGYRFVNWTPAGPSVTIPGSGPVTYTANYVLACYMITSQVNPAGTGTVSLSPASLAGFPAGCYANGTAVTATLTPSPGRILSQWLPWAGGSGQGGAGPYSFSVTGPGQLTAVTTAAPAPAPNVNWAFVSRTGLTATFRVTSNGNLPATNLRITSLAATQGLRYTNQPPLPISIGTLASGSSAVVTLPFDYAVESLEPNLNIAFQVALTILGDNLAASTFNLQVPAPTPAPPTTVRLEAVSRTNSGNTATLVFRVVNTGQNPTRGLGAFLQVAGAAGLSIPSGTFQVVPDIGTGLAGSISFQVALPAGQNIAGESFTATVTATGNVPNTVARWRFDSPTSIVPLP